MNTGTVTVHGGTGGSTGVANIRTIAVSVIGRLINSGSISASAQLRPDLATGILFTADSLIHGPVDVTNSGDINAPLAIYEWQSTSLPPGRVDNTATGTIEGKILLASSADVLTNNGRITGVIDLGAGD